MKRLKLKERIDVAKERTRKLKEAREAMLAERYRIEEAEPEAERFHRVMNDPGSWQRIG